MYANFAGRDASRGMAKQSFEEGTSDCSLSRRCRVLTQAPATEMLTPIDQPLDKLEDLKPDEM